MVRFISVACLSLLVGASTLVFAVDQPATPTKAAGPKKSQASTSLDLEGGVVKGERLDAMGSILEQATPDQDYNFVKVRNSWRKEMVSSPDSLDTKVLKLGLDED